jgi:alanine transaminase
MAPDASSSSSSTPSSRDPSFRVMTKSSINPHVLNAEYAVRGAIPLRAEELRVQLEKGAGSNGDGTKLGFDKIISCNIGNPQQLDQKPLTFLRQVSWF